MVRDNTSSASDSVYQPLAERVYPDENSNMQYCEVFNQREYKRLALGLDSTE